MRIYTNHVLYSQVYTDPISAGIVPSCLVSSNVKITGKSILSSSTMLEPHISVKTVHRSAFYLNGNISDYLVYSSIYCRVPVCPGRVSVKHSTCSIETIYMPKKTPGLPSQWNSLCMIDRTAESKINQWRGKYRLLSTMVSYSTHVFWWHSP